jgi:protein TonB
MFEYAIGHYQKHPPSGRLLASCAMSCLGHAALLLVLIEYPQLLRGGVNLWFRSPSDFSSSATPPRVWRNVALVDSKLEMPPAEELKKLLYDWKQAKTREEISPPIRINLPRAILDEVPLAPPRPRADAAANPAVSATGVPVAVTPPAASAGIGDVKNPAAVSPPNPADAAPKQIPRGVDPVPPTSPAPGASASQGRPQPAGKAEDKTSGQQSGIRAQGNVLFDTQGFPFEEYAKIVKARVEGNWLIPSNLRNDQGSATIVFYITRDGQVINARIEVSSGNISLDRAALSAVWGSNPFPSLPRGFPLDRVGARLVFAYNERQ